MALVVCSLNLSLPSLFPKILSGSYTLEVFSGLILEEHYYIEI